MKKPMIALVISINIFIIFFWEIAQNTYLTQLSFEKQNCEKTKMALSKEKELLQQRLCLVQSRPEIKKFAKNELNMEKIKPHNIKKTSQPT